MSIYKTSYHYLYTVTILHYFVTEVSIIGAWAKSVVSFYSPTIVSFILFCMLIVFGLVSNFLRSDRIKKIKLFSKYEFFLLLILLVFIIASFVDYLLNGNLLYLLFFTLNLMYIVATIQYFVSRSSIYQCMHPYTIFFKFILYTSFISLLLYLSDMGGGMELDTSFLKKSVEGGGGESLYSFPFGLGLIFTGSVNVNIFNIEFSQYSSYFFEPSWMAYSVLSIAFILPLANPASLNKAHYLTLLILIIWANSLTIYIALICALILYYVSLNKVFIVPLILILIFSLFFLPYISEYLIRHSDIFHIFSKLQRGSSGSLDATILSIERIQNTSLFGEALNMRPGIVDKDSDVSIFSVVAWTTYICLICIAPLFLRNTIGNKVIIVIAFIIISSFKTIPHMIPSVIPLFVILSLFSIIYKNRINSKSI
jgi:hypothetical protein